MIIHRNKLSKLNKEQSLSFVRANAALEGHRLSFSDIKNAIKVVSGKLKADAIIEQIILRKGLRRRASSI
jgi:hypothetical protein